MARKKRRKGRVAEPGAAETGAASEASPVSPVASADSGASSAAPAPSREPASGATREGLGLRPESLGRGRALAVFAAALLARVTAAVQLGELALYRRPQLDQLEFLIWARGLAERGFSWPSIPTKGPGYAVFLSWLLGLFDGSLATVRLAQSALGAVGCVLAAWITARYLGRRAGLAAGLILALHGPLVWIDTMLLAEGLFLVLLLAALAVLVTLDTRSGVAGDPAKGKRTPGGPSWTAALRRPETAAAAMGLLLGCAALVRATALALVPVFAFLLLIDRRLAVESSPGGPAPTGAIPTGATPAGGIRSRLSLLRSKQRWIAAAVLVAAAAAVILPVTMAMSSDTGSPFLIQGYGGLNLYMGNEPGSEGLPSARPGGDWDRLDGAAVRAGHETAAAQDQYYARLARQAVLDDPGGWLGTLARKTLWLFQAEEVRESHSYHFFRRESGLLGVLPGFGVLLALAAVGVFVLVRRGRGEGSGSLTGLRAGRWAGLRAGLRSAVISPALILYVLVFAATCVAIIMGTRYRLPMVPVLAVWAGAGAAALWSLAARQDWKRLGAAAAVLAAVWAFSHLRTHEPSRNPAEEYAMDAQAHLELGESAQAAARVEQALEEDPGSALAWDVAARIRIEAGELAEGREAARKALALNDDFAAAHFDLARAEIALLQQQAQRQPGAALGEEATGSMQRAVEALDRALALSPDLLAARELLASVHMARGDLAGAEAAYEQVARLQPSNVEAQLALARLAGARGEPAAGVEPAMRAADLAPERVDVWMLAATLAFDGDRPAEARRAAQRLQSLTPPEAPQHQWGRALVLALDGDREALDNALRALLVRQPGFAPGRQLFLANAADMGREPAARAFLASLGMGRLVE